VKGSLAQIDPDRFNLHGDDPPFWLFANSIITPVGFLNGGPSHYPHCAY
jgi:hypothetical protein